MDKTGQPKGLIRYTTEHSMQHEQARVLRPRIIVYGVLLSALFVAFLIAIALRSPLAVDVLRDRGALYRVVDADHLENVYNFKIMNKSTVPGLYQIAVSGLDGATLDARQATPIAPGEVGNVPVIVTAPVSSITNPIQTIEFEIAIDINGETHRISESSRFFSPR